MRETCQTSARASAARPRRGGRLVRRGFTLVELMVAMVIAAIVMYGVYYIYQQSVSTFRVQNQMTGMLENLRFGVEHLKRELKRAGFQSTTNSNGDGKVVLNTAGQPLLGLVVAEDDEAVWQPEGRNPNIVPVQVTLFGDFWSRGSFRVWSVVGNRVELDGSFYYDENGDEFDTAFDMPPQPVLQDWFGVGQAYSVGRLVRLVNQSGLEMYYHVQQFQPVGGGPDGVWPVVRLVESVPVAFDGTGVGVQGMGTGCELNPVGFIRYRIAQDQRDPRTPDKYDLIREELDPDSLEVVPRTQLTVAEYAVDLQLYDFVFDDGTPSTPQLSDAGRYPDVTHVGHLLGTTPANHHRLRSVSVKLTVRTPDEDPTQPYRPRQNDRWQPLTSFEVSAAVPGTARVRSTGSRVTLDTFLTRTF